MAPSQKEIHYLAKREGSILKYYNCKTTLHSYPLETILEITEGPPNQKKLHYEAKKKVLIQEIPNIQKAQKYHE